MSDLLALQCGFFLCPPTVGNIVCTADVTKKHPRGRESWHSLVKHPAVFTVMPSQAVFHREFASSVEGFNVSCETALYVVRMYSLYPTVADFLLQGSPCEHKPAFVEKSAQLVLTRHPDENRCI